jgi:hypothetical protein
MTNSDAPKPDQDEGQGKAKATSDPMPDQDEAKTAAAEKGLNEPEEASGPSAPPSPAGSQQAALDMMAALCRDFGLGDPPSGGNGDVQWPTPLGQESASDPTTETAFQIIQRFLFDGDASAPQPNFNRDITQPFFTTEPAVSAETSEASPMSNAYYSPQNAATASSDGSAQWGVTTTHADGSTTDLTGPVIRDDMFRTAMPSLKGKGSASAESSDSDSDADWSITMHQGPPLAPGRVSAQTAIGAKLEASDIPDSLKKWSLHVGPSSDAQSELAISLPETAPSQLRALLFDVGTTDSSEPQVSEVPAYGGGPLALHLEQHIGKAPSSTAATPNLALIRLVFADRAPIPAQLEYVGSLPSPIVAGSIVVGPNYAIPFRVQITPPSEGDKGAGLAIIVQYNQETSFDVTAQLLTEAKTTTPTAILTCSPQSESAPCRAASMISNSNGRLETNLTGLVDLSDDIDLTKYGFVIPKQAQDGNASSKVISTASKSDEQAAADTSDGANASDGAQTANAANAADASTADATGKASPPAAKARGKQSTNRPNTTPKGGT